MITCVLIGIVSPEKDAWDLIRTNVVKAEEDETSDDDECGRIDWSDTYSLVSTTTTTTTDNTEGATILLLSASTEASPESVVDAVNKVLESNNAASTTAELLASAPAPLPMRPLDGYEFLGTFQDDMEWACKTIQEWGLLSQPSVLREQEISELRRLVEAAIRNVEQLLAMHRPEICIGEDNFLFAEIASRNKQRFDLRLTGEAAAAFIERVLVPRVCAFVQAVLNTDEFDYDISVVYSRPGAVTQGWHADGDHQKGMPDAGWQENGWRTRLASPYALCLFVPLIDLNSSVGFTQFWPGSHRNRDLVGFGPVAEIINATFDGICRAGDGVWYDYRLLHRGMPNTSSSFVRPVVQIIFKKKWYIERSNYGTESIIPPIKV